jgi:murein DD-endopeptidase MepM/ murein hydrolase activator NlpD
LAIKVITNKNMEEYKIKPGDTLSQIAQRQGTTVQAFLEANPQITNPDLIYAGHTLKIPGVAKSATEAAKTLEVAGMEAGTEIDEALAPPIDTKVGPALATIAGEITSVQDIIRHLDAVPTGREATEQFAKTMQESMTKRAQIREDQPSVREIYEETLETYGLTPESMEKVQGLTGQLASYQSQIATLEAQKQATLDRIEATPGRGLDLMTREQNEASKRYNREITAKAAQASVVAQQIELERGNWTEARAIAGQIVELETYEMTQQLSDIDWVMSTYSEVFDIMSKADRDEWNKQYDLLSLSLKEKKDELMNKQNLIIRAAENGISLPSNLDYEDTVKEYARLTKISVDKAREIAAMEEDEIDDIDLSAYFAPETLRKIRRAGIDPTTEEGFHQALAFVEQEEKPKLTNSQIGQMGERGVSMDIANDIHGYVLMGYDFETIYNSMKDTFGPVTAGKYVDVYRDVIRTTGMTMLVPETPGIEIRPSYEERARREAEEEQQRTETKKGTETKKERTWYKPWTWF